MKHWTAEDVLRDPSSPDIVQDAAQALVTRFDEIGDGGYPRLVSISHTDNDDDVHEYEVVAELAPGLLLPAACGYLESVREGWDEPEDVDDIVQWVVEGVEACMPMISRLSDQLHEVRMRARRIIAGWPSLRVQSRLVEARLAPYDAWRGSAEPGLVLFVEGSDERLRRSVVEFEIEDASALDDSLDKFRDELARQLASRERLARLGASAEIGQLALNAIAYSGDVEGTLRRFDREERFLLPDATSLEICDGEVIAGNGDPSSKVLLGRAEISFVGKYLPDVLLVAATGRPVTDNAEHPFLTSDMTVIEAICSIEKKVSIVTFRLDMPQWLFCTATGRTWPRDNSGTPTATQDNVVELRTLSC